MNETTAKFSGDFIRYFRERKSLTQAELGALVGVTQQAINQWERIAIPKKWRECKAVCEALDCEPVDLLTLDTKMLYNWLTMKFKEALLRDDSLEVARLSRQVLDWERFFSTGSFFTDDYDEAELTNASEVEQAIAVMMRGQGDSK